MKRISFLVALFSVLVLSFGLTYAQSAISVDDVVGKFGGGAIDTVGTSSFAPNIIFKLRYTNASGGNLNISNGYEIYSPDGATWSGPVAGDTSAQLIPRSNWDLQFAMNIFDTLPADDTPKDADTIGIIAAKISAAGLPSGFNGVPYGLQIGSFDQAESGLHICVDSAWFRPGGTWKWVGPAPIGNVFPTWGGPYCYTIYFVPNIAPSITNCETQITGSHCVVMQKQFTATDPEGDPITFQKVSGPGTVSPSGLWTYTPSLADVGASLVLVVQACDAQCGQPCSINIVVTNEAPVLQSPVCGTTTLISTGNTGLIDVDATDACNDPLTYSIVGVNPPFAGSISIDPNTGVITASPVAPATLYTVTVSVTDGNLSAECDLYLDVIEGCPFGLQISKEHNVPQGGYWSVPVTLIRGDAGSGFGGFNILIAYDNSALSFQNATLGAAFGPSGCGWEYFTYRFGADGNCSGGCPSGLVRVVGMAETNNGANHPSCGMPGTTPVTLFNLNFLVSSNLTLNCQYVPIRFFWLACEDNTFSNDAGDELYVSCTVADFENTLVNIANGNVGFPTYLGVQNTCLVGGGPNKPAPIPAIDFINGGIDIVCVDSIDARGDINLNGLAYEIADAVNFTNYFVHGIGAFTINVQGQIAATDVNNDGIALSVADLVYLVRVIVGDAQPYPKINPVAVNYAVANGVISVDGEMGAAYIVAEGNVTPTLLADNMAIDYAFDGVNTRILVYPPFEGVNNTQSFSGAFVSVPGNVVSIEMATADGAPVTAKNVPTSFSLDQNYPNPFNPSTQVSFNLPVASKWTLTVYNVIGQEVMTLAGESEAGPVAKTIDMANYGSGVYFYTLNAGSFSATKKMMLVK